MKASNLFGVYENLNVILFLFGFKVSDILAMIINIKAKQSKAKQGEIGRRL